MDKKAQKRDIAAFSHMMKELMNTSLDDKLVTLDRDIQHFIYGRVATLVKHNDNKPIGSISDISCVVGAALADVLNEFTRNRSTPEKQLELFANAKAELMRGFEARSPKVEVKVEESAEPQPEKEQA